MNLLSLSNKLYNKLFKTNLKLSFSQCGEDSILMYLIHSLKLKSVMYFDIGTNDPRNMNNTYLMYLHNFRGVCIEPDPAFHENIRKYRPGDTLIASGVSLESNSAAEFYLMDDPVLNTFSLAEADKMVLQHNRKIVQKIIVPLISINEVFKKFYDPGKYVIVSLDVEGLDFSILQSIDFSSYRPAIICVETVEYSDDLTGVKDKEITAFLSDRNYKLYADTHINSIFVDESLFTTNRKGSIIPSMFNK